MVRSLAAFVVPKSTDRVYAKAMKRLTRFAAVGILVLTLLPASAQAADFRSGEELLPVAAGQTLDDDLYAAGSTVTINGTVNGDVVVAGSDVVITGTVNGSVWAAGSTVTISGTVTDSLRAAGSDVTVSGSVGRDVLAFGSNVEVSPTAKISRDLVFAGSDLVDRGSVGRNVKAGGNTLVLSGPVAGSVDAEVNDFTLGQGAAVAGTIDYTAPKELNRESGSQVTGAVNYTERSQDENRESFVDRLTGQFYWFLASLLLLIGILLYARRAAVTAADQIVTRPG